MCLGLQQCVRAPRKTLWEGHAEASGIIRCSNHLGRLPLMWKNQQPQTSRRKLRLQSFWFCSKSLYRWGFEYKSSFQMESIAFGVPPQQVWGIFEPVPLLKNNKRENTFTNNFFSQLQTCFSGKRTAAAAWNRQGCVSAGFSKLETQLHRLSSCTAVSPKVTWAVFMCVLYIPFMRLVGRSTQLVYSCP